MCPVASLTIAKIYDIFKELEFITQKCVCVWMCMLEKFKKYWKEEEVAMTLFMFSTFKTEFVGCTA